MRKLASSLLLMVAGCDQAITLSNPSQEAAEIAPAPVADLLRVGDTSVCAHPEVLAVFAPHNDMSFDEAHSRYQVTEEEYKSLFSDDLYFSDISASDFNPQISQMTCQALTASSPKGVAVEYFIRPSSSDPDSFAVLTGSKIDKILMYKAMKRMMFAGVRRSAARSAAASETDAADNQTDEQDSEPAEMPDNPEEGINSADGGTSSEWSSTQN